MTVVVQDGVGGRVIGGAAVNGSWYDVSFPAAAGTALRRIAQTAQETRATSFEVDIGRLLSSLGAAERNEGFRQLRRIADAARYLLKASQPKERRRTGASRPGEVALFSLPGPGRSARAPTQACEP
jgi:hypothetical protein